MHPIAFFSVSLGAYIGPNMTEVVRTDGIFVVKNR